MRQTGFLAASAAYALTNNFSKLATVHDLTRKLERGLLELGVEITGSAETCIVRFYLTQRPAVSLKYQPLETRYSTILLRLAPVMPRSQSVPGSSPIRCLLLPRD